MDAASLVPLLLVLSLVGIFGAVFLLRKGSRSEIAMIDESLVRDREHLERLEALDQRLERLEKMLHDLPS